MNKFVKQTDIRCQKAFIRCQEAFVEKSNIRKLMQHGGLIIGSLLLTFAILGAMANAQEQTGTIYIPDCNDPGAQSIYTVACTDVRKDLVEEAQKNGYEYYIGHDEPALQFFSNTPGSGNNMRWKIQLPTEPTPTQDGTKIANFELFVADWLGLALCDPNSFPFGACTPNSDANNPFTAGSAFLELQFFPPGLEVSNTQWSALLHINNFERNNSCKEPTTAAFITTNGNPGGSKLLMNNGDNIEITMRDTANGLEIVINDLTTATSGSMIASGANGFFHTDPDSCATSSFDYHPEYSTAKQGNLVPWASLAPNVDNSFETGHWELCGDSACNTPPDGNDTDDFPFVNVRGIGGSLNSDNDKDGIPYHANWPDGSANHPSSLIIGAPDDHGAGPLSFDGTNYLEGYNKIHFATTVGGIGALAFYPFYSQAGTGTSCRFNFGNDISGTTTNDFGKISQYGTTIDNPCLSGEFNYSLSIEPLTETVLTGDIADYGITATLNSGTAASITLSASGLPSGAIASFNPTTITPTIDGTVADFQVATSTSGGLGDFVIAVQGTGGGLTNTINTDLHVYDFTVNVSPSDQTVLRGGGTSYIGTLKLVTGSTTTVPTIVLSTKSLPSDVTTSFSPSELTPTLGGVTTTLTVGTASPPNGSLGDFLFLVVGKPKLNATTVGNRSGTSNLHIYDFNLTAIPPSLQILTTGFNSYSITDTLIAGSSTSNLPTIVLSLSGLPSGATGIFNPISGTDDFASILNITTSNSPNGTNILNVTGTDTRSPEGGSRSIHPTLIVLTPQQALQLIINQINTFQTNGVLNKGQANSLIVKLENTIDKLDSGIPNTACNDLGAFVNEVNADVKAGILTQAQADLLLGGPLGVNAIMKAIPC